MSETIKRLAVKSFTEQEISDIRESLDAEVIVPGGDFVISILYGIAPEMNAITNGRTYFMQKGEKVIFAAHKKHESLFACIYPKLYGELQYSKFDYRHGWSIVELESWRKFAKFKFPEDVIEESLDLAHWRREWKPDEVKPQQLHAMYTLAEEFFKENSTLIDE